MKTQPTRLVTLAVGALALMMTAFAVTPAFALGTDWDGGVGNWSDSKWSTGQAPDPAGAMTIDVAGSDVTVAASTTAASLVLGNGSTLSVAAAQNLAVSGQVQFKSGSTSSGPGTITAGSYKVGDGSVLSGNVTIGANLAGAGGMTLPTWGRGLVILTGVNTFSGVIGNNWQQFLRADEGAGLSPNANLALAGEAGIETGVDLVRPGGAGAGEMRLTSGAYGVGFTAVGGPVKVCFGSLATPTQLTWNDGNYFRIDGNQPLTDGQLCGLFLNGGYRSQGNNPGENNATHPIEFVNPIDLGTIPDSTRWARLISVVSATQPATMSGVLSGARGIKKRFSGELILTAKNTYTGNTQIDAGTLTLADNAQLKFVIPATSGGNSSIYGAGTCVLNGDFCIDTTLTDASELTAGTWQLETVTSLPGAYGSTFQVVDSAGNPWTDAGGDKWTKTVGTKLYTFAETDGTLTLTEIIRPTGAVFTVR